MARGSAVTGLALFRARRRSSIYTATASALRISSAPGRSGGARPGPTSFVVDYPGYASSDGEPTLSSCCEAARAALEHLLARPETEVSAVVVIGRSVGSIFALDVAARTSSPRVRALALESGIADLKARLDLRVTYERLGLDRRAIHAALDEDFDHQRKMSSVRCPVLVLHARHDSLVPSWNSERLAEWAGSSLHSLVLFDEGDHNDIQWVNADAYRAVLAGLIALPR